MPSKLFFKDIYACITLVPFFFFSYLRLRLCLLKPMVVEQGQRFTLRDGILTLGTGVITKINPRLKEDERMLLTEGRKGREKTEKAAAAGGKK